MNTILSSLHTALVVLLSLIGLAHHQTGPTPANLLGGTTVQAVTWKTTIGVDLFDTPDGFLHVGQCAQEGSRFIAYYATSTDATTTYPAHISYGEPKAPSWCSPVSITGIRYIDLFSDGSSYIGDPAVGGNLNKPNAPIPTQVNDATLGIPIDAPTI